MICQSFLLYDTRVVAGLNSGKFWWGKNFGKFDGDLPRIRRSYILPKYSSENHVLTYLRNIEQLALVRFSNSTTKQWPKLKQ